MRSGTGGDVFFATLGNVAGELSGVTRGGGGGGGIGPTIVFPVLNSGGGGGGGGGGGEGERENSSASKSPMRRSSLESYRLGIFFC